MTMRVSIDDVVNAEVEQFSICPHFFQSEIDKAYELRVVVVGGKILAFRIDSQQHRLTELDWRKGMEFVPFIYCEIDVDLQEKITSFMSLKGLFFGSLDLIIDVAGNAWFLECNQDGAWGWLDDIAEGAVTNAFADAFKLRLLQMPVDNSSLLLSKVA